MSPTQTEAYLFILSLVALLQLYESKGGLTPPKVSAVAARYGMTEDQLRAILDHDHAKGLDCGSVQVHDDRVSLRSGRAEKNNAVSVVFEHWRRVTKQPRAVLDSKRSARIAGRLREGFTAEQLCTAADALAASKWHQGDNPNGVRYLGVEHAYRDAETVEKWLSSVQAKQATDPIEQARREAMERR
jgi:hypothetical protein